MEKILTSVCAQKSCFYSPYLYTGTSTQCTQAREAYAQPSDRSDPRMCTVMLLFGHAGRMFEF
jgi:hypothetical protein